MKLNLLFIMSITISFAQVGTGFEEVETASTRIYKDTGDATINHELINNSGEPNVSYNYNNGELGFKTLYEPGSNGSGGLTDGDSFGVQSASQIQTEFGDAFSGGSNSFMFSDVDGIAKLKFDAVNLVGTTNPQITIKLGVKEEGWEIQDYIKIYLEDESANLLLSIFDTSNEDIDTFQYNGNNLEEVITTITSDVTSINTEDQVILVVEFSSNSNEENIFVDDIDFSEGIRFDSTLSITDLILDSNEIKIVQNQNTLFVHGLDQKYIKNTKLYSILGQEINVSETGKNLNTASLNRGIYILMIETEGQKIIKKVAIE